jgi:hypothetical protein
VGESSPGGVIEKVDPNGNVVWSQTTSRPVLADTVFQDPASGATSLYVTFWSQPTAPTSIEKLDASTGSLLWSKAFGPQANAVDAQAVEGRAFAVDAGGNVYLAGTADSGHDFDPGPGVAGGDAQQDLFLVKLDASGNFLSLHSMDNTDNLGASLALDSSGNLYTAGSFGGTATFDTGSQTVSLTNPGPLSLFVVKTTQDTGTIFGRVFNDLNNNGVLDVGSPETGIPNVTVYLDLNNSGAYVAGDPTSVTNSQGDFNFKDLTPGSYTVRQMVPTGYTATPASFAVSVAAGLASDLSVFADFTPNKSRTYSNPTAVKTNTARPNAVSSLTVPDSYTVLALTLTLNVSNTKNRPLTVTLKGPDGTTVSFSTNANGTVTFETPVFDYKKVTGKWTVEVDGLAGGTLNSWSLDVLGSLT